MIFLKIKDTNLYIEWYNNSLEKLSYIRQHWDSDLKSKHNNTYNFLRHEYTDSWVITQNNRLTKKQDSSQILSQSWTPFCLSNEQLTLIVTPEFSSAYFWKLYKRIHTAVCIMVNLAPSSQ